MTRHDAPESKEVELRRVRLTRLVQVARRRGTSISSRRGHTGARRRACVGAGAPEAGHQFATPMVLTKSSAPRWGGDLIGLPVAAESTMMARRTSRTGLMTSVRPCQQARYRLTMSGASEAICGGSAACLGPETS